ncbi:50S ribosomal protein L3 [Candidatus Saccharibacteria bacterium]|nr:50S ribosomal protein L3 [Candidatus Saccharibacteria bacterium]
MKALLAKKIGMTQVFEEDGRMTPVTVLEAGPCVVTQIKTAESDGYNAVQIGFGKAKHIAKPQAGHLKKAKAESAHLAEIRMPEVATAKAEDAGAAEKQGWQIGEVLTTELFETGEKVTVSAVSKGKGFAGTVKRHNFHTGPKTHGSHNYRAPGSIGAGYPQHVFKGQKMAGHLGHQKVTVKNQPIVSIDAANHLIAIRGAVPGPNKSIVMISAPILVKEEATE